MASKFENWYRNLQNMPTSQKLMYPVGAAGNIYKRLRESPQYTMGAGGVPTPSSILGALQPQTAYASEPDGTFGGTYSVPKADGGYDYFVNGQPASVEDYYNATGNVPQDEPAIQQTQQTNNTTTAITPTGGGGSAPKLGFARLTINGQIKEYNLDDPNQKVAFFSDKMTLLNQQKEEALARNGGIYDQSIDAIRQEIADTQAAAQQYVEDYNKNVNEFGEGYSLGGAKRGQYYSSLSPNAFQSSQGTSAQKAESKYIEGLGDMAQEAQSNVGSDFLSNPENFAAIGEGTTYGRAIGGLKQERQNLGNAFADYERQLNTEIQNQAASTASKISPYSSADFSRVAGQIPTAQTTDLSPYTAYTQFTGKTAPMGGTPAKVYTGNKFTPETGLNSFLGRNKLDKRQEDLLKKYLLGTA